MVQIAFIGLGAGAASALLFASIASGSLVSVLLFYLAPLPILIAALGWSHLAGLIAAFAAAIGLAFALGSFFFTAFLFGVGLPAWWLGYLALLARPAANGGGDALDWYPIGRLALWAAIIGALIVVSAIPTLGVDEQSFRSALRRGLERMLSMSGEAGSHEHAATGRLIDLLVRVVPPAAAVLSTVINIINLWLAARVVNLSGRLRRPWPDLASMRLPALTPAILAAAVLLTFVPGMTGIVAGVFVAALLMLYGILGLAILHFVTRGMASRGLLLGANYAAIFVLGWPMLALTLLGLADIVFDLRKRRHNKRGPPNRPNT
jgi:Predicted membrane protein (DUF2232)